MLTYDDIARVKSSAPAALRPNEKCWVVAVIASEDRARFPLPTLPPGTVYTVEFECGESIDIHEHHLEPWPTDVP